MNALRHLLPPTLVLSALTRPASASDIAPSDAAAVKALLDESRALSDQGQLEAACTKIEAARRIESTPGISLSLGRCYDKLGRTASAYGVLDEAARGAERPGDKDQREAIAQMSRDLAPRLSRLRIEANTIHLDVRIDGKPLPTGAIGSAIPIDPGDHTIEASAKGRPPFRLRITVEPRPYTATIQIPDPVATPAPVQIPRPTPKPIVPFWDAQRVAGVVLGGGGLAGIAVGAVYGVKAAQSMAASNEQCFEGTPDQCTRQGYNARQDANAQAWSSNIIIGTGALAVAGGLVLFLTAKPKPTEKIHAATRIQVQPLAGAALQGLAIHGSF